MSIMNYNGAAIVAMAGDHCLAIASDRRLGAKMTTVSVDFVKIFRMSPKLYIGLAGLATDVQTVHSILEYRMGLYQLKEEREMSPQVFCHLVKTLFYEKRFGPYFCEPIIAGLDEHNKPFLADMDFFGATAINEDYCTAGSCADNLLAMCESFYRPKLAPEDLLETISQTLMASTDRNAACGLGGIVHIITAEGVTTTELKARMD